MNTKHLDQSLFFAGPAGGTWRDAVWGAAVTDDTTGEIIATAVNPQPDQAWSMVGVRMNREFLATLRELAGVTDPLPADTARAELAYWRESVQFCVDRLMAPARWETKGEALMALHNVESYLRQLLELDGSRGVDGSDEADGADVPCYDCRTTGERLAVQEDRLQILSDTMRRIVAEIDQRLDALEALLEETTDLVGTLSARQRNAEVAFGDRLSEIERRLATIERRQEEDAATFVQHARRLDGIDEELGDQTQRLSALEERVSEVERLLKEMSNREQIDLRQFLGLAKQVDALEVKAASAAVHLGQVPNVVKRINELDHLVHAVIKDCVAIENRLEAQEERLASSLEVHDARD